MNTMGNDEWRMRKWEAARQGHSSGLVTHQVRLRSVGFVRFPSLGADPLELSIFWGEFL
jgi:hypothetical protein